MNFPSCLLISIILSSICTIVIVGESANSKKKPARKEDKRIFIDDDLEGSGIGPDTKSTDMVYSGSGYGPDDEDASEYPPENTGTKTRTGIFNEKGINNVNVEDKHGQTLPMPTPKSTAAPTTTTKAPEFPIIIEDNSKTQEPEIAPKIPVEPPETKSSGASDKLPPVEDNGNNNNGVYVVNTPDRDRTTSFFAQPGILAAVIGGAVVGLLCAILVVMFIVYRMRKKDEGSYPLEEMKRCPATNPYIKPNHREFFA